ncbi:phosphodiesterase [Roseovarius sp. ZX-A-9]|uniref:phosphodiesterase n=1 Tax=Roseovarius sp. ZX-A-9 TaxID=3014783 RepID=UPI00232BB296|nr:phosphodiesterase [Roseovarius sp. ZX-A-9]
MAAFIQITDTHIVPEGELAYNRSDTAAALNEAVASINAILPRLDPVDCAIITGDLTDYGTPAEYARLKRILAELQLPYLAIPGNHDVRDAMRAAFADQAWMPEAGPIQWHRDFGDFSVIGLDTLVEGSHHGMLCDEGLAFLDRVLETLNGQPVVVATHHPWMHSGVVAMDNNNLRNGGALLDRLEAYGGPARMISGHVHRTLTTQIGKVTCQIAPAPCHAVHLSHQAASINSLIMEPGGVTLWNWHDAPRSCLVSNVIPVGTFKGPWPFYG